jgi:hypothetical protein
MGWQRAFSILNLACDCIKTGAEREGARQRCKSAYRVREMHRLFHKTVEKTVRKILAIA